MRLPCPIVSVGVGVSGASNGCSIVPYRSPMDTHYSQACVTCEIMELFNCFVLANIMRLLIRLLANRERHHMLLG